MTSYRQLTPEQARSLHERSEVVFLDVRTVGEWVHGRIPGAVHIPLHELPQRVDELDPDAETIVVCAHGVRSDAAGHFLVSQGFASVANMRHGMAAWAGPVER